MIRFYALGGLGEIGKNLYVVEKDGKILILDCGLKFSDVPGVDFLLPDFSYLEKRAKDIVGLFLSHGHEDHIGGVPFFLQRVRVPVISSRLSLELVKANLGSKASEYEFIQVAPGESMELNPFELHFVEMRHSIPEALGLYIKTDEARIFFTGDYKIEVAPVSGKPTDFKTLSSIGEEGVDFLLADSTNAEPSMVWNGGGSAADCLTEQQVYELLDKEISSSTGRVIVSTFASHIDRIQQIIKIAQKEERSVAIEGRSLIKNMKIAEKLGYMDGLSHRIVTAQALEALPRNKQMIIASGSQGEPLSALVRISSGTHKRVKVEKGDKVIIAAYPIPGNERAVTDVINSLLYKGAEVRFIHSSGHPCTAKDHQLIMLNLLKPRYLVPIHGEWQHLVGHADIGKRAGLPSENIFLMENGDVLVYEKDKDNPRIKKHGIENVGTFIVDGILSKVEAAVAVKERMKIGAEGVVIVEAVYMEDKHDWLVDTVMLGVVTESSQNTVSKSLNDALYKMLSDQSPDAMSGLESRITASVKEYLKGMNQYPEVVVRLSTI
ncbi:ribonuclease J [Coprothermobacter platensis]|uniref:ribonuclease J n=1 Tax=Coprothermobacter platensis TaxID=108819 RepID=UPI00036AAFF3|nr:RNase J family beta-CASP ribonuclease [Coprothermobacter platensis]